MPAPAASQGGGGQGDHSYDLLWILVAIGVIGGFIWFGFRTQIAYGFLTLKIYELDVLTYLGGLVKHPLYFETLRDELLQARSNITEITFMNLVSLGNQAGDYVRIPLAALMVVLGILVYVSSSARIYRRTYNMQDFAKLESQNWPQISPVVNLDLIKTDIDTGPWAMALTPMLFCKKYKLLEEVRPERKEGMSRKDWDRIEVVLKRGATNKIFVTQLGPLWMGTEKLPPYARALFAVFAARINADTKAAQKLLKQLSESSGSGTLNYAGVNELIKKHEKSKLVQNIVRSHAYGFTVMASMLLAARDDGVQASADFLWLKPVDRRLWYILNTVGRQTPFVEVAGIFAHWLAEKEAGRRLYVPMVEEATNAMVLALKEVIYRPDEETT